MAPVLVGTIDFQYGLDLKISETGIKTFARLVLITYCPMRLGDLSALLYDLSRLTGTIGSNLALFAL